MAASTKKLEPQVSLDMRETDEVRLLDFLNCVECHELANDAMETLCCKKLLCAKCLERRGRQCPKCNETCSSTPSHLARRLIGLQQWTCPECGKETARSEQTDHELICPQRIRTCPAGDCDFTGQADAFLDHLVRAHSKVLLNQVDSLFQPARRVRRRRDSSESSEANSSPNVSIHMQMLNSRAFRGRRADNSISRDASRVRMHVTGKNYCSGRLNGPPCDCCDGSCGPGNGCNCVNCMRRDLVTFGINRPRMLVNREGVVAWISRETGMFYCGRGVMGYDSTTDGYCGPNNGHNCHACHKLDEQLRNRYADISDHWDLSDVVNVQEVDAAFDTFGEDDDVYSMPMGLDVTD